MDQHTEGFQMMLSIGARSARTGHDKVRRTAATLDTMAGRCDADPAKALVMTYLGQLVGDGYAEWHMLDNGDVELRFYAGETFLLADTTITRIF
jgi:hypothetical protein